MRHLCGRLIVFYALALCVRLMHVLYAVEAFPHWFGIDLEWVGPLCARKYLWAQAPTPPETHNHKYIDKTLKLMQGLMRLKRNLSRVKVPWLTPWAFMPFGFLFMRLYARPTPCGKLLYAALCRLFLLAFLKQYIIVCHGISLYRN